MTRKIYILFIFMVLTICINAQSRYAEHSKLATGKWVKIRVADEGVYQLTSATLKKMGFSNPDKVSLYGYNLPMLPEAKIEELDDDLTELPIYRKSDGTLLFYSCGTTQWSRTSATSNYTHKNNPYSNYIYYFLTENTGTPASWTKKEAQTSSSNIQKSYSAHALYEQDTYSFLNTGKTFFESYDYATGATKTYALQFENACCGDLTLDVQFGAAGNNASSLNVAIGTNSLGTISISKVGSHQTATIVNKSFKLYDQTASSLNVTLKHTYTTSTEGHLDYLRANYEAELSISGKNYVAFSPDNHSAFELQGANTATSIWDVTVPTATHELSGTLSGTTYKASLSGTTYASKLVAVNTSASFPTPSIVGEVANQDLHALKDIDLLIIVPANGRLTAQAQRLANAHTQRDGIQCAVVEADKIYNEFSSGTPDATAYRRLMKMLYDKRYTSSPLTGTEKGNFNILLFGNCMWDNRFVTQGMTSYSQNDYLLAYESINSWSHTESYILEDYFTLLADGKGISPLKEKPDCGVGRLPVTTESEAKIVVDKLISTINNTQAGGWKNTVCIMADDGDKNDHINNADSVLLNTQELFPDYRYKRIYWDSYNRQQSATGNRYPDVYAEINKTMQEGALIMNYTGHGAAYTLSHEQVLKTADFQNWTSPRLPLWVTAACDVAPFDMNTENIGCEALLNKKGGAMGFIGTARTVYSSPNCDLNLHFMSHVFATKNNGDGYTIGEALAQAKVDILEAKKTYSQQDTINKVHFILLGDPAIKLNVPSYKIKISKLNGQEIDTQNPPIIAAGETVTAEGYITDGNGQPVNDFKGLVFPIVYDNLEHITCKNNTQEDVDPVEYDDHIRIIYSGTDSIKSGAFTFTFPVPIDINYSDENGQILLYAVNQEKTIEAQGKFEDFLIGGTAKEQSTDDIPPSITTYTDGYKMTGVNYTTMTPTLTIELYDESGINTTGNGLGHDIVAIIDGNESTTYNLNSYYSQAIGDYCSGTIQYTLPTPLATGKHTLVIRAFDTFNNMGEAGYTIEVVDGLTEEYDIFDLAGRQILNTNSGITLPTGVYIKRRRLTSPIGIVGTTSEKFIVTQ